MDRPSPFVFDGKCYYLGICPECFGVAIVLNHYPTAEYCDWVNRISCQNMINYMEETGLGELVTKQEWEFAFGEAA